VGCLSGQSTPWLSLATCWLAFNVPSVFLASNFAPFFRFPLLLPLRLPSGRARIEIDPV